MGNITRPHAVENKWGPETHQVMAEFWERERKSPNPRMIAFKEYKFPFTDPIDLYGHNEDDPTHHGSLKLANYAYPAHYEQLSKPRTLLEAFTRRE
jgi:hypothetical protein